MEAIRRKIKRNGNKITIELPEDFKAENIELIILPDDNENSEHEKIESVEEFRKNLLEFYSKFNVDLSNYKFNRDELYDRK
ncbi:MAG: hypothetical protein ABI840_09190 [bacterium]